MDTIPKDDSISVFQQDCPCPKKKCVRHNKCQECHAYHGAKGKLPYCLRGKASRNAAAICCHRSNQ